MAYENNASAKRDKHHIFFTRRAWKCGKAKLLRDHPYCSVTISRDTIHNEIHATVSSVPMPNPTVSEETVRQLDILFRYGAIKLDDPIEKRLTVLIAILDCVAPETVDALREQLRIVYEFKKAPD